MILIDNKEILIGLISSFAPLAPETFHSNKGHEEVEYLLSNPRESAYNAYQSIFITFYLAKEEWIHKKPCLHLQLDPFVQKVLDCYARAATNPVFKFVFQGVL